MGQIPVIHCGNCGFEGLARRKGSVLLAVILWFAGILPGLVYTLWMLSGSRDNCPVCSAPYPIPIYRYRQGQAPGPR
ncbi:MAG: hypothetical protein ACRD17_02200 [Terriglobales bacterium]